MEEKFCARARSRALALADQLIDEKGKVAHLKKNLTHLEKKGYFLDPFDYNEGDINDHFLRTLRALSEQKLLVQKLQSFGLPLASSQIEETIAHTLGLKKISSDREVVWAVLTALLTPLRQTVGSCFATATAILVHEEQPGQFLDDLQQLLSMGRLTRVFGGIEYTVPVCPSQGIHLLKTWEYTVASFVDVKTEFSRWNLYSSLGLHPEEKGGIGELIYQTLEMKLEEINQKVEECQAEYEIAFDQVRATEQLMRSADTEAKIRRLKAEHQSRLYHMQSCQDMRDKAHRDAQKTAEFFPFLIEHIIEKFQEHFQEVYDPDMQEVQESEYDDRPAGFRLLHKHGRTHVGSWSFIHNKEEYIEALRAFFLAIEHPLIHACEWEGGKAQIPHLITAIVYHIESEIFLLSAFSRLSKAHLVPLKKLTIEKLETLEKKPWAYTSGGTIPTLVKTYFRREGSLSEESRWVENAQDLAIFFLEMLKSLPPRITKPFTLDPARRMLATSPTHAFSLLPGQPLFREGWEDPHFTYTFVRDRLHLPAVDFYESIRLSTEEQRYLIERFASYLPPLERHTFLLNDAPSSAPLSPAMFAQTIGHPRIASFLFEMLPLAPPSHLHPYPHPIGRRELHDHLASQVATGQSQDIHAQIARDLASKGLAPPSTCLFADTNWEKFSFSFVTSPINLELELWRTDKIGLTGAPMIEWTPYLTGQTKEGWSLFLYPPEYTS